MRRIISVIVFAMASVALYSQERISLNGEWRFLFAPDSQTADTYMDEYLQKGFSKSRMDRIQVPSNWAVLGYEEPIYRGFKEDKASEGFYQKTFNVPENMLEKRLLLHFGGVWSSAEVWLNGKLLGHHYGGYTPFAFDVTELLQPENTLMVRVRQSSRGYQFDVYDDWTLGGIYRDVEIESMPRRRSIEKMSYTVDFDPYFKDAVINVRAMIHDMHKNTLPGNYPSPGEPYSLIVTLADAGGNVVASRNIDVEAHISTDRELYCSMNVAAPEHWTAETPYLYDLKVGLKEGDGAITHMRSCKVGFREISTDGGVFRINGQPVKLRGVNRHDEHPDVGRATRREHWLQDIQMMKEANINYIRCAHYTPAKGFVELCDSLGMYLGNEVSLGGAGMLMYDPSMIDGVLQRTYETIDRDLNNPCIVYWSIGNEDPLTSQHMTSVKLAKAIDPTRPVLLPWRAEEWLPEEVDILAPHYWQVHEYDSLAATSIRPIITTEYTHAFGDDGFGSLQARWNALTRHPAGAGAAVWMWADQGIRTPVKKDPKKMGLSSDEYLRISDAGWDGIVDSYRNLTRDYHELKAVYAYVYPTDEKVAFSIGDQFADIRLYNAYDFRNLNTVKVSWKLFEGRNMISEGTAPEIYAAPHSTGVLRLPVTAIKGYDPAVYYAWLTFTSADGYEIATRSVELIPDNLHAKMPDRIGEITVSEEGQKYVLKLGDCVWSFDKSKGLLMSMDKKGKRQFSELRPALWHNIDRGDRSVIGKNNIKLCPNLDKYTSEATYWNADVTPERVVITSKVKHVSNEENSTEAAYTYTLTSDGRMSVSYELLPSFLVPSVPVAGMRMKVAEGAARNVGWFGKGPYTSHPNRRAAGVTGYWDLEKDPSAKTLGVRDYKELYFAYGMMISGGGYFECDGKGETLSVYTDVLGRPEKGRKPLDVPQMLTDDEPFTGKFIILSE